MIPHIKYIVQYRQYIYTTYQIDKLHLRFNQYYMGLGATIKKIREQKEITQQQLATAAPIANTYLSLIEQEKNIPSLEMIDKIAKALDLPATILVFMATDENDIKPDKVQAYRHVRPLIDELIKQVI